MMNSCWFNSFFRAAVSFMLSGLTLQAGSITVEFRAEESKPADYTEVNVYLLNAARPSLDDAVKFSTEQKAFTRTFDDLDQGRYLLAVFTGPLDQVNDASRPGAFLAQQSVTLDSADAQERVVVQYKHLDVEQFKGEEKASGRITDASGNPQPNVEIRLSTIAPTAGHLVVARAVTGEDGSFEFSVLKENRRYELTDGSGNALGELGPGDRLDLKLPPQKGRPAPNISFIHLDSGKEQELVSFKGKVVVLDFWASWCGPCQEPMAKMQTYREKHPGWGEKVELIALSIDNTREAAVKHLETRGWNKSYNAWAGEGGFNAEAPVAYGVRRIPTAYIFDKEGKVAETGDPMVLDIPSIVNRLLAQ